MPKREKKQFTYDNGYGARVPWEAYTTAVPGLLVGKTPKLGHMAATAEAIETAGPGTGWSIYHEGSGMRLDVSPRRTLKKALADVEQAKDLPIDWTKTEPYAIREQVRELHHTSNGKLYVLRNG